MVGLPSVELLTAFAAARSGKKATGISHDELLAALKADPEGAAVRLQALLTNPRPSVRAWACIVGAKVSGRRFVPVLLKAFSDRSQEVQEMVISGLNEIDPTGELLRPLTLQMRQRLLTWDVEGGFRIARLLTLLNDTDAAPYLARYLERREIEEYDRRRAESYLIYLTEGLEGVLNRIRDHADHARMDALCKLAFAIGSRDVEPAVEQLLGTAPDQRCRMIAQQTLDALGLARAEGAPPYWDRSLLFDDLPPIA
jgi:hypothetical protein